MTITELSMVGLVFSFAGGVVSFASPCVLPLVPIYLGHLSGASVHNGTIQGGQETFGHSIGFVAGFSTVFIILGATMGVLGGTAGGHLDMIAKVAGIILVALGLYMTGVFKLPGIRRPFRFAEGFVDRVYFRERRYHGTFGVKPSYWRSVAVGGAFAVGWTPCITPVLGAILTLAVTNAAGTTSSAWSAAGEAAILLTAYSAGLSIPFLVSGFMFGRIGGVFKWIHHYLPLITVATGVLMIGVGVLVYQNTVSDLNQYFAFLPYVTF